MRIWGWVLLIAACSESKSGSSPGADPLEKIVASACECKDDACVDQHLTRAALGKAEDEQARKRVAACRNPAVEGPKLRFTITNDEIVDHVNGVTWARPRPPIGVWSEANAFCEALTAGGHDDWRIPTLAELDTTYTSQLSNAGWESVRASPYTAGLRSEGTWHCVPADGLAANAGIDLAFLSDIVPRYVDGREPASDLSVRDNASYYLHPCSELPWFWSADACAGGHHAINLNRAFTSYGAACETDTASRAVRCVRSSATGRP